MTIDKSLQRTTSNVHGPSQSDEELRLRQAGSRAERLARVERR